MGVDQSVSSARLNLSPVLLQEECKHLSQHTYHSVVKPGL